VLRRTPKLRLIFGKMDWRLRLGVKKQQMMRVELQRAGDVFLGGVFLQQSKTNLPYVIIYTSRRRECDPSAVQCGPQWVQLDESQRSARCWVCGDARPQCDRVPLRPADLKRGSRL
jgi:hypothetical protein